MSGCDFNRSVREQHENVSGAKVYSAYLVCGNTTYMLTNILFDMIIHVARLLGRVKMHVVHLLNLPSSSNVRLILCDM